MNTHQSIEQSISEDIYKALLQGKKLLVTDAHQFESSETAFPRRIKDIEAKHNIKVERNKVKVAENRRPVSQYSLIC